MPWSNSEAAPTSRDGLSVLRLLTPLEQDLLRAVYTESAARLATEWANQCGAREIFWINLWQRTGGAPPLPLDRGAELDAWVRSVATDHYDAEIDLDGYGFVINPPGSRTQAWHLDYSLDYSSLLVPLSPLTPNNAPQYLVLPSSLPLEAYRQAIIDPDVVDLGVLLDAADCVSIRQLIAKPFNVLKLDFGTIHRGISNTEPRERVMFWISVKRPGAPLPVESLFQVFTK
ncbi:MAG TPA: hypothetical protein VM925_22030 [Labilithrix sp.]|jgi:hypothetical protein|nr:hypothetical protein [Labilithrix sp.]